jgi:hypothetical protein
VEKIFAQVQTYCDRRHNIFGFQRLDNYRFLVTAVTSCTSQVGHPTAAQSGMGFHMAALITVIRKRSIGLLHPYRWYDIDGAAL